jgi:hypothetical protein
MSLFACKDVGPLIEYSGSKIDMQNGKMKLTQPVLLQSFEDEFGVVADETCCLPAKQGPTLTKGDGNKNLDQEGQKKYRSRVGKLRHGLGQKQPSQEHYDAVKRIMTYCVSTVNRGWQLKPDQHWNGSKEFVFVVCGLSDSNFHQCCEMHKSVSQNVTVVNGVPVLTKSTMQDTMKLSVMEAELDS